MNHNIYLKAIAISLVSNNGKFSYSQTGEMYSKVSSYQVRGGQINNGMSKKNQKNISQNLTLIGQKVG